MPTARELLDEAERRLSAADVPSPRVDSELLLTHVTGRPRALVRGAGEVAEDHAAVFRALVERRASRIPLQHLTGTAAFRYLELVVGPGVFVPRPETELLVDAALAHLRQVSADPPADDDSGPIDARWPAGGPRAADVPAAGGSGSLSGSLSGPISGPVSGSAPGPVLVDLCTGSGALALALATELTGSSVHAVEFDDRAAQWAKRNLAAQAPRVAEVGSHLQLHVSDATRVAEPGGPLAYLAGRVDVVVTNPPYIPDAAIPRDPEVRDHDPKRALFGGPDGLDVVRALVGQAARLLRPGGLLAIEHADVQGEAAQDAGVPGVLRADGSWREIADHHDLAGLPRFTTAVRAGPMDPAPTAKDVRV